MRARRLKCWGMLVVAATVACGDAVAPAASSRDLEFTVPATAVAGAKFGQSLIESPYAGAEVGPSTVDGGGEELVVLDDRFVKGWFEGSTFVFEYGLIGVGTGYTMSPKVVIVGPDGRVIINQSGLGRSEDSPIPLPMRPTVRERIDIGISCGATGTVGVVFQVRLALITPEIRLIRSARTASDVSFQPACAPPPPPAPPQQGGGGPYDDSQVWLCWYDVWYDSQGRIVAYEEISCTKLGGEY